MAETSCWVKEIPTQDGWYWIKYKGKSGLSICPCGVSWLDDTVLVQSARGACFMAGPRHGGPQLKYDGKVEPSIRFGPKIEPPE